MRTRPVLLTAASALLVMASAAYVQAQSAPAGTPKPVAKEPAATPVVEKPAAPEVVIKDVDGRGNATKTKDSAGRDTLSVDFPEEDIRNILRNVASPRARTHS